MRKIVLPLLFALVFPVFGSEEEHPLLPADTSSPRATLNSFMENCETAYRLLKEKGRVVDSNQTRMAAEEAVRNIKHCMNLEEIADFRRDDMAKEAAVSLKEVLDRIELPKERNIPDRKDMMGEDGQLKDHWTIPNTEITFELVKTGMHEGSYRFSSDTVERSREFLQRVAHLPYKPGATEGFAAYYLTSPGTKLVAEIVDKLPISMWERRHGLALWQWIGMGIVLLGAFLLMALIYLLGRRVSRGGAEGGLVKYVLGLAFPIMAVFVPLKAIDIIANGLVVSGMTLYVVKFNLSLLALFAGMVVVLGIGRRVGEVIVSAPHIRSQSIDAQLIRVMSRLFGFIFAMVLLLQGGQHLGIPLSSLLAGAGVAGAALALSAQDLLKNVFGSIMLIMDKPFVVGERIKVKQYDGVVEEVGLRSTKIRLLNGHQAIIPNEDMARTDIENIGRRPFIRRVTEIPLPIDIPPAKAKKVVEILQALLKDHEGFNPDFPPRIWIDDFERDHLGLKMIYWYHPPDYWKYTKYADRVNRQILDAFESEGIAIALPAFTTRMEGSAGVPGLPVPDLQESSE
jgi:MscS family membrane protein